MAGGHTFDFAAHGGLGRAREREGGRGRERGGKREREREREEGRERDVDRAYHRMATSISMATW